MTDTCLFLSSMCFSGFVLLVFCFAVSIQTIDSANVSTNVDKANYVTKQILKEAKETLLSQVAPEKSELAPS